jgi:hypothetical protein
LADRTSVPSRPNLHASGPVSRLGWLDHWMASHPWHPRILPFLVYITFFSILAPLRQRWPASYPLLYVAQCGAVLWLLWRYRKLLPELTLKFHWAAVPVGLAVGAGWIGLGLWMNGTPVGRWLMVNAPQAYGRGGDGSGLIDELRAYHLGWPTMGLRLLGMALVVPLFEELFIRSLLLRSLHGLRATAIGVFQLLQDLPLLGDWLLHTHWGDRAGKHPPKFAGQFEQTPLGQLGFFGVSASTFIFMIHHPLREWPGCVVCGLSYCFLLRATARRGLGPVVWAHGITNAVLWAYTLTSGDWQFL